MKILIVIILVLIILIELVILKEKLEPKKEKPREDEKLAKMRKSFNELMEYDEKKARGGK